MSNRYTKTGRPRPGGTGGRHARRALLVALLMPLAACDLTDVENPNDLVEEDVQARAAANAVANGALATVSRGIGFMIAPYSTTTDELTWIGSRDAWNQLNQGNMVDPANEFVDAAFPFLAEGRWMADNAIEIVRGHIADESTAPLRRDLARSLIQAGIIKTTIGDMMEDFAFSDRQEGAPAIGAQNMFQVYEQAIDHFTEAISIAEADGRANLVLQATALRARAQHALAVWQKIQGSVPADPLVSAGVADAQAAIAMTGGEDWMFQAEFSSSTISNNMAFQVNERGELQFGEPYATRNADDSVDEFIFTDPITGEVDTRFLATVEDFMGGSEFVPITLASAREMHLILAEADLAAGNVDGFTDHINAVRVDLTNTAPFEGPAQLDPLEMLKHERRTNLYLQGRRLADHYRFGEPAVNWLSGSPAINSPGTMFPITCIEVRANLEIDNPGC